MNDEQCGASDTVRERRHEFSVAELGYLGGSEMVLLAGLDPDDIQLVNNLACEVFGGSACKQFHSVFHLH